MKVSRVDIQIANIGYEHRELSSQVARDGVSAGVVRLETDDGLVGWGEICAGADIASEVAAARAMLVSIGTHCNFHPPVPPVEGVARSSRPLETSSNGKSAQTQ